MVKKILVIGKQGQLAQELEHLPPNNEVKLFIMGRPESDISDQHKLAEIFKATSYDLVINACAYTAVDKAESSSEEAYKINRDGVENLAKLCNVHNIPLIHISTDYVFDGSGDHFHTENEETNPINVYGASKFAGEQVIVNNMSHYVIIRTSWVYSSFGNNFVKTMLKLGAIKDELNIIDDQIGGPTYAKDLGITTLQIAEQILQGKKDGFGIFNYCGKEPTSWYGFACEIFKVAAKYGYKIPERINPISAINYPTPAKRPSNSRLNCTKLLNVYGIKQPLWQDSLQKCLAEIAKNEGENK